MILNPFVSWSLGFLIVLFSIILGEVSIAFNDYVFHRLGINRNILLILFWSLFLVGPLFAAYSARQHKLAIGLSYILIIPIMASIAHYINGMIGSTIDFKGWQGALTVLKIYFVAGSVLVVIGTFIGILFSRKK